MECRNALHGLFMEGAIWLPEAEGTLTHTVLQAIKHRTLFMSGGQRGDEIILMSWPAPGTRERELPVLRAREFFKLVDSFMNSTFPGFDVSMQFNAFHLGLRAHVTCTFYVCEC